MNSSSRMYHHRGDRGGGMQRQQDHHHQPQRGGIASSSSNNKSQGMNNSSNTMNNNSNSSMNTSTDNNGKKRRSIDQQVIVECGKSGWKNAGMGHQACSVSWNSTGSWLAATSGDRLARIWSGFDNNPREVVAVSGHQENLDKVRFHPAKNSNLLLTSAHDRTIRLWDLRGGSQRSLGMMELQGDKKRFSCPMGVEWGSSGGASMIVVAERDNRIYLYDSRKLPRTNAKSNGCIQSYDLNPHIVEGCQLSPNGNYLVAATTTRPANGGSNMGDLRVWPFDANASSSSVENSCCYPGHTGPISHFTFSLDGTMLATGGCDAIVGLWDTEFMICTQTITQRPTKFIRSVSISHDSKYVAYSTEDEGVDIFSIRGKDNSMDDDDDDDDNDDDENYIGTIRLPQNNNRDSKNNLRAAAANNAKCGADAISFHPTKNNIMAFARCFKDIPNGATPPPIAVAKWNYT